MNEIVLKEEAATLFPLIEIARKFPRNMETFFKKCQNIIESSPEIAGRCYYCLPRKKNIGNKQKPQWIDSPVEGASIRLAEIMAQNFGNYRLISQSMPQSGKTITTRCRVVDLETLRDETHEASVTVYNEKDVETARLNSAARAYRNAIFHLIPKAYTNALMEIAKKTVEDSAGSIKQKFENAVKYFSPAHTPEKILKFLNKDTPDHVTAADIQKLKGIATAIKEGILKLETAFDVKEEVQDEASDIEDVIDDEEGA